MMESPDLPATVKQEASEASIPLASGVGDSGPEDEAFPFLDYASLKAAYCAERASAKELRDSLENRYLQLRTRETALIEGQRKMQETLDAHMRQNETALSEAAELNHALRRQVDVVTQEKAAMQVALDASSSDVLASNQALFELLKEHQDLKKSLHESETRASAARTQSKAEVKRRDTKLADLKAELDAVTSAAVVAEERSEKQVKGLNQKLEEAQRSIKGLADKLQKQVAEIQALKDKLAEAEARITPESHLKDLRSSIHGLIESNCELEAVIGTLRASNEQLESELEAFRQQGRERELTSASPVLLGPIESQSPIQVHRKTRWDGRRERERNAHRSQDTRSPSSSSRTRRREHERSPSPSREHLPRSFSPSQSSHHYRKRRRYSSPPPESAPPVLSRQQHQHQQQQISDRALCNSFMMNFRIPSTARPSHFLGDSAVQQMTDAGRLFEGTFPSSRKPLYLPQRTFWCNSRQLHAFAYAPTLEYSSSGSGQQGQWRPHTHLSDLAASGDEVDYFVSVGQMVYYAGIYRVRSLLGVEGYEPGRVLKSTGSTGISPHAMYEAMNLPPALSTDKHSRDALIRQAYPDTDGRPRTDCFGLQYVGYDGEVQKLLRARFLWEKLGYGRGVLPAGAGEGQGWERPEADGNGNGNMDGYGYEGPGGYGGLWNADGNGYRYGYGYTGEDVPHWKRGRWNG
ncbi:hypothetical protein C8F01DRAFT_1166466 [Mycena amicta]|nr:hypothetical protein C8F01DRAFT_1166466 [Mycena amicta]